jgi:cytochrome bd-type quinol oxidase subunit 1
MNALLIFVVRLILGLVFGIILTRLFRPEWGIYHGVVTGLVLVALAYGMAFFRKRNQK